MDVFMDARPTHLSHLRKCDKPRPVFMVMPELSHSDGVELAKSPCSGASQPYGFVLRSSATIHNENYFNSPSGQLPYLWDLFSAAIKFPQFLFALLSLMYKMPFVDTRIY